MTRSLQNRRAFLVAGAATAGAIVTTGASGLLIPARAKGVSPTPTMRGGSNNYIPGAPIVDRSLPEDSVFVLSDHREFTDAEAEVLGSVADERVSLGPEALHADQAITVAHNYLDTDGYTEY